MNRPIIIGVALFVVAFGVLLFLLKRQPEPDTKKKQAVPQVQGGTTSPAPTATGDQRRIKARLFFNHPQNSVLVVEERAVLYHDTLRDQSFEVLRELIIGSKQGNASTIPEGTTLRDVFLSKQGIAYVDFSPELATNHGGGSSGEINTVYSIVNTLTINFPQIKGVQILVDDRPVESLKGHLDLSRPLKQNLSIVRSTQTRKAA